ncbi:ComF family protein [Bacillus marinisedimentorum]|uniref:ComF family protein n=1 Tax=Bacillus marinisedimentorum TaxID=1821260 RepID=UPI0007E22E54|nr:ComF family protein [Bacillus marinisedimentorum]
MSHCLWCHQPIDSAFTWVSFIKKGDDPLCEICAALLKPISRDNPCMICGRDLNLLDAAYFEKDRCIDCIRWEEQPEWAGILTRNVSLFHYNDGLKEIMARFKYRGDYQLRGIFSSPLKRNVKQTFDQHVLVPIPLSAERLYERGFNQAEAIAAHIGHPVFHLLERKHGEKQSKKDRKARMAQPNPFYMKERGMPVEKALLIDDIYTTGSTLRFAARTLKEHGVKEVSSITIARG